MTKDVETRFTLRMPEETSEKIAQLAKQMGVSKNAYILMVLAKEIKATEIKH
ncbi:toxin-antitoxin system HicB family antitoxin [Brevibacillus agri]|uniref:toxin-antitoxin system HicB family antitoxin n=1 Tax=Brevibacillus agri TaxID=51101 RepID=UPI003D22847D